MDFLGIPEERTARLSKWRIGGYRSSVENGRTHADLEEGENPSSGINEPPPFRFRGRNDLRACGRSPPVRVIISHEFLR